MATGTNVIGALLYLRTRSLQNLLLSRLRRLKQPKYLIGAVVGAAYLYFVFLRRLTAHHGPVPGGRFDDMPATGVPLVLILGASALLVFVALCWILRRSRAALSFSEAEIAFLFPAPVSRRTLIHYRLTNLGLAVTYTALILALVSSFWPGVSHHAAIRFVGWWLIFATLSLHVVGSSFVITRWLDRGISPLRYQLMALGLTALLIGVPIARLWHGMRATGFPDIAAFENGPVALLLFPFKLLLNPLLSVDGHAFLLALWPALLLYAAHYLWVLQVQVGFEEASIAKAEKRATALAAIRAGNWRMAGHKQQARRAPFNLERAWRPELAFLWKNLLSTAGYLRPRTALIAAAIIVLGCNWFAGSAVYQNLRLMLASVVMAIAGYLVLLGPQLARQDFRSDLSHTDILKTYPLHGWQIMLGEILTPAAILTVLLWLMLLTAALLVPASGVPHMAWLTPPIRMVATLGLALLAPLLCMSQLLIVNAAAVLFPAWLQVGTGRAQPGIEVMGQRIFFMAGQLLALVVMLLPATFVAAVVFFLARWIAGDIVASALAALLVAVILGVEVGAGIGWLGGRFERLDLSTELRP